MIKWLNLITSLIQVPQMLVDFIPCASHPFARSLVVHGTCCTYFDVVQSLWSVGYKFGFHPFEEDGVFYPDQDLLVTISHIVIRPCSDYVVCESNETSEGPKESVTSTYQTQRPRIFFTYQSVRMFHMIISVCKEVQDIAFMAKNRTQKRVRQCAKVAGKALTWRLPQRHLWRKGKRSKTRQVATHFKKAIARQVHIRKFHFTIRSSPDNQRWAYSTVRAN